MDIMTFINFYPLVVFIGVLFVIGLDFGWDDIIIDNIMGRNDKVREDTLEF